MGKPVRNEGACPSFWASAAQGEETSNMKKAVIHNENIV
jgi:hypothetical protein